MHIVYNKLLSVYAKSSQDNYCGDLSYKTIEAFRQNQFDKFVHCMNSNLQAFEDVFRDKLINESFSVFQNDVNGRIPRLKNQSQDDYDLYGEYDIDTIVNTPTLSENGRSRRMSFAPILITKLSTVVFSGLYVMIYWILTRFLVILPVISLHRKIQSIFFKVFIITMQTILPKILILLVRMMIMIRIIIIAITIIVATHFSFLIILMCKPGKILLARLKLSALRR